jgi:hypothetical protein
MESSGEEIFANFFRREQKPKTQWPAPVAWQLELCRKYILCDSWLDCFVEDCRAANSPATAQRRAFSSH